MLIIYQSAQKCVGFRRGDKREGQFERKQKLCRQLVEKERCSNLGIIYKNLKGVLKFRRSILGAPFVINLRTTASFTGKKSVASNKLKNCWM